MIETRHLRLLPNTPVCILALIEEPERYEALTGFPAADGLREFYTSGEVSPAWLAALRVQTDADPWQFGFAVVHRESSSVIGSAGFKGAPDSAGVVEVAYGIVPQYQGRGFATEANMALVAYASASDLVRVIRAHTLPTPNASTRVLKKCEFHFVGPVVDPEDGPVWRWEREATVSH
jgi:RimJ/RimL family protein N-acetyltransferase